MVLFIFFGCNQRKSNGKYFNVVNDSLSIYFDSANDFNLSKQKRLEYILKANEVVINQDNDSLNRVNLFKVANRYYNLNYWKEYNQTVNLVLNNSERAADTVSMAKAFSYLGDYYLQKSVSDSAFLYYYKAEKVYAKLNDKIQLAKALINKAELLYRVGDLINSEKEIFNVLRIIKNEKSEVEIFYDAYNLLGLVYNGMDEYENAILYHKKALKSLDEMQIIGKSQTMAISYLNLGLVYMKLKKYKLAKDYFLKGIEQQKIDNQDLRIYALLLDNLGYSKYNLNEDDELPELFYKSLKIRDSLNFRSEIPSSKIHLSEYYSSKDDTEKSLQFAKEALFLAKKINRPREILLALKQISIVDPQNASNYTKEYIRINEELQKDERKIGEKFTRIQYDTDQIKGENTDLATKNRNLVYFFSCLTILGLFIYIIKSQKAKNRELLYKQQQQKANEDIYNLMISQQNTIEANRVQEKKRVAQELHDGVLGRMFGVRMNLEGLNQFNDDLAVSQRNDYLSELKNIEQDIREISHDLNREKSELINNFVAIVDNLFEEQRKTFPSKLISNIDSSIKWDLAVNSVKINLYRIIQESLQNINKYANATTIKVDLKKQEDSIVLVIADDGVGFNVNLKKKGIGLQNMISRAKECNGEFAIKSKKGEGTTTTVTIPLE
ncbi:tetratricopeptide repeat-containing sensor histidine kinase [Flavobacterium seoulense]|uniref:histidine kinase n=1 Tax=Flavobacterium seoulense TaxID=1492738 RepID=A0A066WRG3_9FLAO|nr:tetratricopeptide repeat-containing sensor histidine kinase [Flavobacterium seoulense]KDN55168.1 histidine kinase [Flavobacterium seoulense]